METREQQRERYERNENVLLKDYLRGKENDQMERLNILMNVIYNNPDTFRFPITHERSD